MAQDAHHLTRKQLLFPSKLKKITFLICDRFNGYLAARLATEETLGAASPNNTAARWDQCPGEGILSGTAQKLIQFLQNLFRDRIFQFLAS